MSVIYSDSGILETRGHDHWLASSQGGSKLARTAVSLDQVVDDLRSRVAEVDVLIHSLCLAHMARCGITSWDGGECALKFWCNGSDATLRWHVSINPLEPADPPICMLAVTLGTDRQRVLYGSVVADLYGAGPLHLSQTVVALIAKALGYETE